ncbi:MAG: DUF72 domain-containing protein [Halodesulfurarchaeum sp.]
MDVRIGTCGYRFYDPPTGWKDRYESKLQAYSTAFPVGELNRTFYSLPMERTARRWRAEAVESFEFTLKGYQAITHSWRSPTWNGHRDDIPDDQTQDVGHFQPTEPVIDAWKETKSMAKALDASLILLQTPPSFGPAAENVSNMREFFSRIDRSGIDVAWEPRGEWHDDRTLVEDVCSELDLIHVVDPLRDDPVSDKSVSYLRLHGLNDDRYDYDYRYSSSELDRLADRIRELVAEYDTVYCLFNNYHMYDNATSLIERFDGFTTT